MPLGLPSMELYSSSKMAAHGGGVRVSEGLSCLLSDVFTPQWGELGLGPAPPLAWLPFPLPPLLGGVGWLP